MSKLDITVPEEWVIVRAREVKLKDLLYWDNTIHFITNIEKNKHSVCFENEFHRCIQNEEYWEVPELLISLNHKIPIFRSSGNYPRMGFGSKSNAKKIV
jgi:hypothetical protein